MRILGVDPSLKATGYGFIEHDHKRTSLIETGTIEPKRQEPIHWRLHVIHQVLDELLQTHRPGVLVLEKIYAHHVYTTTASILGHVRGVVCLLCAQHQIDLVEYSVKRIRKALVGNGNASKQQTRRVVGHVLNIPSEQLTLDASDALALALGYVRMHGDAE